MVRSKFPGKPSKIVNRKVLKSNKYCALQDNESSKAAENISYGLAVFNETFGDHEQVLTAFHGFSPHEVDQARETADKLQEEVEQEYQTTGLVFPPDDAFPVKIDPPTQHLLSVVEANLSLIGLVGSHTTRAQCQSLHSENSGVDFSKSLSPSKYFSPFKVNLKKRVANRLLLKAKKANFEGSAASCRLLVNSQSDKNGSVDANALVKKFKLPVRSIRSSRVIKPNKRFLDSEESEDDPLSTPTPFGQQPHARVIELKKPRLIFDGENDIVAPKADGLKTGSPEKIFSTFNSDVLSSCLGADNKEHVKLGELNVFGAPTTRPKQRASQSSMEGSPKKDASVLLPTSSQMCVPGQSVEPVSPSRSKVILRESKLNISSASKNLQEVEFSKKPKKGPSVNVLKSSGTSFECGICGDVRFHRLTKQTVKFGLLCCDICCKFIAKMILRARSSESSVPCEKGQGNCAVPSPSHKGESFSTKINRCGACWILLCVQRLVKMPENIRDSLIRMLPANMQGMTVLLPPVTIISPLPTKCARRRKGASVQKKKGNSPSISPKTSPKGSSAIVSPSVPRKSLTSPPNKRVPQTPVARIRRKAALVSLANNMRRVREKAFPAVTPPGSIKKKSSMVESLDKPSKMKKFNHSKKSEVQSKGSEKFSRKGSNKTLEKNKDGLMRQKLTFKGPRVKHVCRSASIVLGQPLATFPMKTIIPGNIDDVSNDFKEMTSALHESVLTEEASRPKIDSGFKDKRSKGEQQKTSSSHVKTEVDDLGDKSIQSQGSSSSVVTEVDVKSFSKFAPEPHSHVSAPGRRITRPLNASNHNNVFQRGQRRTLQDLGVYNTQHDAVPELLSLDFWESYDPDEVCNTGFGLIGFDPFYIKPVCFLCGSAGTKKLIHCASCCEPYHQFCVEMGIFGGPGPLPSSHQRNSDEWRVDWVCPRCTVCHGCGHSTGHQLTSCQRCHHSYHLECLGTTALRKSAGDRLWICSSCLRCKSCNSADVTKFVGNLPFCKICFKLRQKGNFCPLCQGCYTDDDYQSKMMECADCKSWVHAKCEGLSDEKYQVLSYLPESVEYICRLCSVNPPAPWWVAVEAELQTGYNNIIKAITKNRKACAMLKWSPQKSCDCQHVSLGPVQKIATSIIDLGKRRLTFNPKCEDPTEEVSSASTSKSSVKHQNLQVAALHKESQVSSVFEFDDDIDAGENAPITRYIHTKEKSKAECSQSEYSNLHLDCRNDTVEKSDKGAQFSPNAGSQSDSGVGSTDDELKTCSATEEEDLDESKGVLELRQECSCKQGTRRPLPTLLTVKKKVHSSEYSSILEFHRDMDQLINEADSHEVKELYHQTLQEVFPWFDPKYDIVSRNSFPLSPCKPHYGSRLQYQSNDSSPEKLNSKLSSSVEILKRLLPQDAKELDDSYFYSGLSLADTRVCNFCKLIGDRDSCSEGRLVYCGLNEWVHVNCALWSAEVFEEIDGALQNVSNALSRGRMIRCSECGIKGASVGCCAKKCEETVHFPCARKAGFVFMEDKNVYCPLHTKDAPGKPLTKPSDFDICRPVFVELDRRKKKCVESKHVRLMIGSLFVENLGSVVPDLSDQSSSIVPTQFLCTRLFWSSKEPWRIVSYTIRTTVRLPVPEPLEDIGHHITVDHSKESSESTSKMDTEALSRKRCFKGNTENSDIESNAAPKVKDCSIVNEQKNSKKVDDSQIVMAVVGHILDAVCCREADEESSDAQNSADLLPPELKDAIFEDLPHDLLDGISMQDIFQDKFLTFEESGKDESLEDSSNGSSRCESNIGKQKKLISISASRELKRSKSDVLPSNAAQTDQRLHQRSCSLAWSCKLGTNISCSKTPRLPASEVGIDRTKLIQELRLSVKPAPSIDLRYCIQETSDKGKGNQSLSWPQIMQVDGNLDAVVAESDEDSDVQAFDVSGGQMKPNFKPFKFTSNFAMDSQLLRNRIECLRTITSATLSQNTVLPKNAHFVHQESQQGKRFRSKKKLSSDKKCVSRLWKKMRIPQLDGTNDISSDSEHDVPTYQEQSEEKPVRCSRCGCTYRTEESYTRHLPSCSGDYSLTTSESEAEMSEDEAGGATKAVLAPSPDSAISVSSGSLSAVPIIDPTSSAPQIFVRTTTSSTASQGVNQTTPVFMNTKPSSSVPALQMPPNLMGNNILSTVAKVQKTTSVNKSKGTKVSSQQQTVKLVLKGNQSVFQHQQSFQQSSQHQISQHAMQQPLPSSVPQQSQVIAMLDYQQAQQSGPTVLVQSVSSPAMVPAYLEAFQQHTGQNLQYLATVDTNGGFGKTQYLTAVPSTVVPGAFQLQAMPDGQLCLEPSPVGIPTLSGLQLAPAQLAPAQIAQAQPQMLGTLLQSPLSCGVVATTEPVYETIQMYPDQSGGVLLASQPMLTCMETVVSNTYMSMSSSQFVSSSVPGMLQGSSTFSTTTTQVFQASKVDPPVMDVPTQYVVVNTHPSLPDSAVGKLEVMSISQPQTHEQAQIQIPSINLPSPVTVTAPLPPQTLPPLIQTSAVGHLSRIQPQRTYSKPTKMTKDCVTAVAKISVPRVTCATVKESVKAHAVCKIKAAPISSPAASNIYPKGKGIKIDSSTSTEKSSPQQTIECGRDPAYNPLPDNPLLSPSELITTSIAPAQSITLPDPVKSNSTVADSSVSSERMSESVSDTPGKCTPTLFSYRSHVVEKVKSKENLVTISVEGGNHVASKSKVEDHSTIFKAPAAKQSSPQAFAPSIAALPSSKPNAVPHFSVSSEVSQSPSTASYQVPITSVNPSPGLTNNKPPSRTKSAPSVSTQSHPIVSSYASETDGKINVVSRPSSFTTVPPSLNVTVCLVQPEVKSQVTNTVTNTTDASTASPSLSPKPVLSFSQSDELSTNSAPTDMPQKPVEVSTLKNLTTSSATVVPNSSSTTFLGSMNSVTLVTTTKPVNVNSNVMGLKPLKEINHTNFTSDAKPTVPKVQENGPTSIPPAVLKSTSQNIGVPKKNDVFHSEDEKPELFQNKDKSPTSLKLLFQKHNGCYKVSSSPSKKDCELMAVKLADINVLNVGAKEKKGGKDESENVEPVEKPPKKCQTNSSTPEILYEIHGQDGFFYTSTSVSDAWQKVFGAVQEARATHKMPPLLHNPFNSGESAHNVMGLSNNSLKYLLEQLPGVGNCVKYRPIYHKSRLPGPGYQLKRKDHDLVTKESHSGCARTDPYLSAKKYDMFSWLDSRHRRPPKLLENNDIDSLNGSRRAAITSLPMAMRFRHLRETSKTSVGVFRSDIHGRGLFCLRDIEAGEMVIEYAGEVIRNTLTDNREKYYQSKGIGCYMFKVDDNFTVDATQKGNAARFINHSCEPNCYSRVVDILGKKHIIIFAFRRIPQGEELTYDYKFPIEDEKIFCHCLARRCRKYLN